MSVLVRSTQDGAAYIVLLDGALVPRRFATFSLAAAWARAQMATIEN